MKLLHADLTEKILKAMSKSGIDTRQNPMYFQKTDQALFIPQIITRPTSGPQQYKYVNLFISIMKQRQNRRRNVYILVIDTLLGRRMLRLHSHIKRHR